METYVSRLQNKVAQFITTRTVYGGRVEDGVKSVQALVGVGRTGFGGDEDGGSVGITDGGGGSRKEGTYTKVN